MATRAAKITSDAREQFDAQEIPWKKPRAGRVGTRAEVAGHWKTIFDTVRDGEAEEGRRAHRIGTAFNAIYALWGEVVAEEASFKRLLTVQLEDSDLSVSTAYQYMQLADATTEAEATRYGITKCLIGVDLLQHAGVATLARLEKIALPATDPRTGRPARYPATRRILERALLAYRMAAIGGDETEDSVQDELRRNRRAIDAAVAEHPELAELKPTTYVFDGKARVRVGAFSARHADGLATLARRMKGGR